MSKFISDEINLKALKARACGWSTLEIAKVAHTATGRQDAEHMSVRAASDEYTCLFALKVLEALRD